MEERRCCFTGHRQIPLGLLRPLSARLDSTLLALYAQGCRHFYAGGALGFDTLSAERVLALRRLYADVRLHLLLPCRDQTASWPVGDALHYEAILACCDSFSFISHSYHAGAMAQRNRALVEHADICVAFMQKENSGAGQTVRQAQRAGLAVINLAK